MITELIVDHYNIYQLVNYPILFDYEQYELNNHYNDT